MYIIGIDVGIGGAVARLTEDGNLLGVWDMPALEGGNAGRRAVNAPLLADLLARLHASHAYVEYVGARPGEGAVGAFSFGRSRGVIEGVCAALTIPVTLITAPKWKRAVGLPAGKNKELSRAEAVRRWPALSTMFARVKDDGRAEAALIGLAGSMGGK
jgi:crossover junction endodeoxyribonuclease RuvC